MSSLRGCQFCETDGGRDLCPSVQDRETARRTSRFLVSARSDNWQASDQKVKPFWAIDIRQRRAAEQHVRPCAIPVTFGGEARTSRLGLPGRARTFLYGVQAALIELHEQRFFLSDRDGSRILAFGLSDPFAPRIGHLAPAALFKVAVK